MSEKNHKNHLYTKWLNKKLSDEELATFKKSSDFPILNQIINETDTWSLPKPKTSYKDLKVKIEKQSKKGKVIHFSSFIRIAASIILMVSVGYFTNYRFFDTTEYNTLAEETKKITLPDGSSIILNSSSTLSFNNYNWNENRIVEINGQAYFDIQKNKGEFKVNFSSGSVNVLGTQFDVLNYNKHTSINCYEGKISSTINKQNFLLTASMGVKSDGNNTQKTTVINTFPTWTTDFTSFDKTPLKEVLTSLSLKYGINYILDTKTEYNKAFTGQFINNDLDTALEMVLTPMSLHYSISGDIVHITE